MATPTAPATNKWFCMRRRDNEWGRSRTVSFKPSINLSPVRRPMIEANQGHQGRPPCPPPPSFAPRCEEPNSSHRIIPSLNPPLIEVFLIPSSSPVAQSCPDCMIYTHCGFHLVVRVCGCASTFCREEMFSSSLRFKVGAPTERFLCSNLISMTFPFGVFAILSTYSYNTIRADMIEP